MTKEQLDELLMAINSLVDNAGEWTSADIKDHASALQRMAANLPTLARESVREARHFERRLCAKRLRDVAPLHVGHEKAVLTVADMLVEVEPDVAMPGWE